MKNEYVFDNLRGRDGGADVCSKIRSSTSNAWMSL